MIKRALIFFLFSNLLLAKGGNEVGNGGDIFVCFSQSQKMPKTSIKSEEIESAFVLDLLEMQFLQKMELFNYQEYSLDAMFDLVLERLKVIDPHRHKIFLSVKNYSTWTVELSKFSLKEINDANSIIEFQTNITKSQNCHLIQGAVFPFVNGPHSNEIQLDDQRRPVVLQKELFHSLNNLHKAALLMHEKVYEYFWRLGDKNSQRAREYNGYLFTKEFLTSDLKISKENYWKRINLLNLPIYKTM